MNKTQFNREFDLRNSDKQYCYNCGSRLFLSRSHIIRLSFTKKYEFDFDGVKYLCMNNNERAGCHNIWDDGNAKEIIERFRTDVLREFLFYIKAREPFLLARINFSGEFNNFII